MFFLALKQSPPLNSDICKGNFARGFFTIISNLVVFTITSLLENWTMFIGLKLQYSSVTCTKRFPRLHELKVCNKKNKRGFEETVVKLHLRTAICKLY